MSSSFITALGGLRANQSWLDVIGNNLANSNTPGFKSSRALFSDQFSRTIRPATGPSSSVGGTNPTQIGLGVRMSHVDFDNAQGSLNTTGRAFDLALLGRGRFALSDGLRTYYSRVGTFGLDQSGRMVDQRTGYRVLDPNGSSFTVDTDKVIAPSATGSAVLSGNLPAKVEGPLSEVLSTSASLVEGTPAAATSSNSGPYAIPSGETWTMEVTVNNGAPTTVSVTGGASGATAQEVADAINSAVDNVSATVDGSGNVVLESDKNGTSSSIKITPGATGTNLNDVLGFSTSLITGIETQASASTDLNDLTTNLLDYQPGDLIEISGTNGDGSPLGATFTYGTDGTTVADFVAFLNNELSDASASFNTGTQKLEITANASGAAELSLSIGDGQGIKSDWSAIAMTVTTNGTGPDSVNSTIEVFDAAGTSHLVGLKFERQDDSTWNLSASIPSSDGSVVNGNVTGITFNPNGSLVTPSTASISVQFNGQPAQSINLDLGQAGSFEGLTMFGAEGNVLMQSQDGFGVGQLASMEVNVEGTITGFYTNGQNLELGQFGVATFANELGLASNGDNYWVETPNSGTRVLSSGKTGTAGEVIGGALEESNVDTAEEFVRMIQAQRGFQSNARVITAQSELLQEIVNVV